MMKIITCIALHFGGTFGPASFEPICWARIEVAELLAHYAKYITEINYEVIRLIQIEEPKSEKTTKMANVPLDKFNRPATFDDGQTKTKYEMFVDDAPSACLRKKKPIQIMACASVEALYMLLSYPGNIEAPSLPATIAIDKFLDRPLGETRISLGIGWDYYHLRLFTPKEKAQRFYDFFRSTWHEKRKTFHVIENAKLQGNLIDLRFVNPWMRCLYYGILDETKKALRVNRN